MLERFDDSANLVFGHAVPDLNRIWSLGLPLTPFGVSIHFLGDPESDVPKAGQCLNDSLEMLEEARYALVEGFKQVAHYRQKQPEPNPGAALFFGKFYAADVSLRLYAAGEHLVNAIVYMLELRSEAVERYRKKDHASLQSAVANYLRSEIPNHPVSVATHRLGTSQEWRKTIKYRHDWVHSQPPLVGGFGLLFRRGKGGWTRDMPHARIGYSLSVGGGDAPDLSLDDLLETVRSAACGFTDAMAIVCDWYLNLVRQTSNRRGAVPG